jgi:hypothetical protein
MVLILLITAASVAFTLKLGLPAIEEMKANVELRTMQTHLQQLDGDIKELVSGSAGKTAKRWQPSLDLGRINLLPQTLTWAMVVNRQEVVSYSKSIPTVFPPPSDPGHDPNDPAYKNTYYNFTLDGFADGDSRFVLRNNGTLIEDSNVADPDSGIHVEAWRVAGVDESKLGVIKCDVFAGTEDVPGSPGKKRLKYDTAANPANPDPDSAPDRLYKWYSGDQHAFCLRDEVGNDLALGKDVVRVDLWRGPVGGRSSKLMAQVWMTKLGAMHYALNTSVQGHSFYEVSGGLVLEEGGRSAVVNALPIPPPRTPGSGGADAIYRFFARTIDLQPERNYAPLSYAGQGQFNAILTLGGTSSLALMECSPDDLSTCAKDVRIYMKGPLAKPLAAYFMDPLNGYRFREITSEQAGFLTRPAGLPTGQPVDGSGDPSTRLAWDWRKCESFNPVAGCPAINPGATSTPAPKHWVGPYPGSPPLPAGQEQAWPEVEYLYEWEPRGMAVSLVHSIVTVKG